MMRHVHKSLALRMSIRPLQQRVVVSQQQQTRMLSSTKKPSEDPHQMAARFVKKSSDTTRISGQEALESVPFQVKARNYAMAATLVGFVTGVWWYSMNAVGRADEVSFELEAEEARERALLRKAKEEEQGNLADLEMGAVDSQDEEVDITVAVAAPDEIAFEEEAQNRALLKQSDRPLWKRVVFFWRK